MFEEYSDTVVSRLGYYEGFRFPEVHREISRLHYSRLMGRKANMLLLSHRGNSILAIWWPPTL